MNVGGYLSRHNTSTPGLSHTKEGGRFNWWETAWASWRSRFYEGIALDLSVEDGQHPLKLEIYTLSTDPVGFALQRPSGIMIMIIFGLCM